MSTVLTALKEWSARAPDFDTGLEDFLRSRKLVCLVVMLAYTDASDAFHRELAVYVPDPELLQDLLAMLESSELDLEPIRPPGLASSSQELLFTQHNTSISRKKLQPLLHQFFSASSPGD